MSSRKLGITYAFIHFSVETACFYLVFNRFSATPAWWWVAMLFDALAFIPQSFFGILQDRFPKWNTGLLGTLLMLPALVLPWDLPALVLIGLGNGLINISGAVHSFCNDSGILYTGPPVQFPHLTVFRRCTPVLEVFSTYFNAP